MGVCVVLEAREGKCTRKGDDQLSPVQLIDQGRGGQGDGHLLCQLGGHLRC